MTLFSLIIEFTSGPYANTGVFLTHFTTLADCIEVAEIMNHYQAPGSQVNCYQQP